MTSSSEQQPSSPRKTRTFTVVAILVLLVALLFFFGGDISLSSQASSAKKQRSSQQQSSSSSSSSVAALAPDPGDEDNANNDQLSVSSSIKNDTTQQQQQQKQRKSSKSSNSGGGGGSATAVARRGQTFMIPGSSIRLRHGECVPAEKVAQLFGKAYRERMFLDRAMAAATSGGGIANRIKVRTKISNFKRFSTPPLLEYKSKTDEEMLVTEHASKGFDLSNFFSPMCHLSPTNYFDGGCKINPFYRPGRSMAARVREYQCAARTSQRDRLLLDAYAKKQKKKLGEEEDLVIADQKKVTISPESNSEQKQQDDEQQQEPDIATATPDSSLASMKQSKKSFQEQLVDFKRHTSWMFDKWYDFDAKCLKPTLSHPSEQALAQLLEQQQQRKREAKRKKKNQNQQQQQQQSSVDDTTATTTTTTTLAAPPLPSSTNNDDGDNDTDDFSKTDGIIRGGHSGEDEIYKLENFCLKPMGRLSGYWPVGSVVSNPAKQKQKLVVDSVPPFVEEFLGADESFMQRFNADGNTPYGERGMHAFLHPKNIDRLQEKPKCFVDLPNVVLFPITDHTGNAGHVFHRAGGLLRFLEVAFGPKARDQLDNVTIIYVVTRYGFVSGSSPKQNEDFNMQKLFYDFLGTSWVSVFSESVGQVRENWKDSMLFRFASSSNDGGGRGADDILNGKQQNKEFFKFSPSVLDTPLCFRRALVWQMTHRDIAGKLLEASGDEPGLRTMFNLFGPRSKYDTATLNLINRKLRRCPARPLRPRRKKARTVNPHVLFLVRSSRRRFALQPFLINVAADYVRRELNGTFEVLEHIGLDFDEVIDRFSRADVLIALHGAGMLWLDFMPPGSVILHFSTRAFRCDKKAGVNMPLENKMCDFSGSARAAEQFHVSLATFRRFMTRARFYPDFNNNNNNKNNKNNTSDPHRHFMDAGFDTLGKAQGVRASGLAADLPISSLFMRWALDRAKCLLSAERKNPELYGRAQNVPPQCTFRLLTMENVLDNDYADLEGLGLAAYVQMHLPAAAASSTSLTTFKPVSWSEPYDVDGDPSPPLMKLNSSRSDGGNTEDERSQEEQKQQQQQQPYPPYGYPSISEQQTIADQRTNAPLSRLQLMILHRKELSAAINPLRPRTTNLRQVNSILLLTPCAANASSSSSVSLLAEINAWRDILSDVWEIVVAEFAEGTENCPPPPPAQQLTAVQEMERKRAWHGVKVCKFPCEREMLWPSTTTTTWTFGPARYGGGAGGRPLQTSVLRRKPSANFAIAKKGTTTTTTVASDSEQQQQQQETDTDVSPPPPPTTTVTSTTVAAGTAGESNSNNNNNEKRPASATPSNTTATGDDDTTDDAAETNRDPKKDFASSATDTSPKFSLIIRSKSLRKDDDELRHHILHEFLDPTTFCMLLTFDSDAKTVEVSGFERGSAGGGGGGGDAAEGGGSTKKLYYGQAMMAAKKRQQNMRAGFGSHAQQQKK